MKLRFVYLNTYNFPRGNYMLDGLIMCGFIPMAVIEENSSLVPVWGEFVHEQVSKMPPELSLPRTTPEILADHHVPHYEVENLNNNECVRILTDIKPDLIVLGDCRILKPYIIAIPKLGVINIHQGYLPDLKGNDTDIWAVIHDLPQGCSAHFVDENVDTGPLISCKKLFLKRGKEYQHLLHEIMTVSRELIIDVLRQFENNGIVNSTPQSQIARETPDLGIFRLASEDVITQALEKLKQGLYSHLVD